MGTTARHHPLTPSAAARDEARLGLYVHVPFCAVRCQFCDFATGSLSGEKVERYLTAIAREAELRAPDAAGRRFSSVFFGGGTPSALPRRHFSRLARVLRDWFEIAPDAEITLEANPEGVRPALLDAWAAAGVNRLSMGAQSFVPAELERLGRIHDAQRPAEAVRLARAHGFRRLSLDLMFAFPGHDRAGWKHTLERALALDVEHLSAYAFIAEDGAPMGAAVLRGELALPPAAEQARLYQTLVATLGRAGYGCYETSNFARPGGEARHNLVYWLRRDHLALGPSAHGLWRGVRHMNVRSFDAWADGLVRGTPWRTLEPETIASRTDEVVMLALRLGSGLQPEDHAPGIWQEVVARFGARLERGVAERRLIRHGGGWRISARHRFIADEILAWVLAGAAPPVDTPRERSVTSRPCPILPSPAV
jgi:oxygen-independent coproporphyrinogen-3 oxidase